jgi:hypothetical protein
MTQRLAQVAYWVFAILAVLIALGGFAMMVGLEERYSLGDIYYSAALVALATYGIGWAIRYVMIGRVPRAPQKPGNLTSRTRRDWSGLWFSVSIGLAFALWDAWSFGFPGKLIGKPDGYLFGEALGTFLIGMILGAVMHLLWRAIFRTKQA